MDASETANLVVSDAGPLIHLDELGCLGLLRDFLAIQVPDAVWREVHRHRPSALRRRTLKLHRVVVPKANLPDLAELAEALVLDAGELEALIWMQEYPDAIFLTDDAAARLAAERLGYKVHGTIGVVIRALRRKQKTRKQVLNLLRAIPRRTTLFITPQLLKLALEQVKSEPQA